MASTVLLRIPPVFPRSQSSDGLPTPRKRQPCPRVSLFKSRFFSSSPTSSPLLSPSIPLSTQTSTVPCYYHRLESTRGFQFQNRALEEGKDQLTSEIASSENSNPSLEQPTNSKHPKRSLFYRIRAFFRFLSNAIARFLVSLVSKSQTLIKTNKVAIAFASVSLFTLVCYAAMTRFPSPAPPKAIPYSQFITQVSLRNVVNANFEEGSNRLHFNLRKQPSQSQESLPSDHPTPVDASLIIESSSSSSSVEPSSSQNNALAFASKFIGGLKPDFRAKQRMAKAEWEYTTRFVKGDEAFLLGKLREADVAFVSAPLSVSSLLRSSLLTVLYIWLPLAPFLYLMLRQFGGKDFRGKRRKPSALTTKFDDVAGVDQAKAELMEVVQYMKGTFVNPEIRKRIPKGILLVGPPGTGKTLLARAVAGESGLPFFSVSASEFVEMFVGRGAARIRELFFMARKASPSVLFIDELDAVGGRRGGSGFNDEREQTLNQLLTEMDGFDKDGEVLIIAATNRVDVLDPALIRSGRISRQVHVGLPDAKGRADILAIHLRGIDVDGDAESFRFAVASFTEEFSGADLANLVNEAVLLAAREGVFKIRLKDAVKAYERVKFGVESGRISIVRLLQRKFVQFRVERILDNQAPFSNFLY